VPCSNFSDEGDLKEGSLFEKNKKRRRKGRSDLLLKEGDFMREGINPLGGK